MNVLAIETSTDVGSVALRCGDRIEQEIIAERSSQTKCLLPCVDTLLRRAGIGLPALDAIAFGCGPGSFTGVRIASTIAQGLAMTAGIGLVAVSSLAATAQHAARTLGQNRIFVCADARMGEVYVAEFGIREGIAVALGPESLCRPADVRFPATAGFAAVGSGLAVYADELAAGLAAAACIAAEIMPEALDLLPPAHAAAAGARLMQPGQAGPQYLRGASAWKKRGE
jgi:tRNA threonylcarbamoyladenosine biosynthesis protein TsaB